MKAIAVIVFLTTLINTNLYAKSFKLKISKQGHPPARVDLPRGFKKRDKWPLIVNIHGYKGNIFLQRILTRIGTLKNSRKFVMITPQSTKDQDGNTFWNGSNFCCDFYETGINDKEYIRSLILHLANHPKYGRIDLSRVYLFGHSNGAFLSYKIACELPDLIAGVAGYAGTMDLRNDEGELITPGDPCPNGSVMPVYHIHGTKDATIKFEGHDNLPKTQTGYVSAEQLVSNWREHNKCDAIPESEKVLNSNIFVRGKETTEKRYSCENGAEVVFAKIQDGTHAALLKRNFYKQVIDFLLKFKK